MLLEGKKLLVTGVLHETSIAFSVARLAQEQGAEIVLTSFGRAMSLTKRTARKLPTEPEVLEVDVTDPAHLLYLTDDLSRRWGRVDGALHAVAFAPANCLGGDIMQAEWDDVATTAPRLRLLAQGPGRGGAAADAGVGGIDRRARLRRPPGVARLRLDGRGQGGPGGHRPATWPATWAATRSGSTWCPPGPLRTIAAKGSPGSRRSRRRGAVGRRWAGTPATPRRWPRPAWPSCRTGSRRRRARWSTSTAASTRWLRIPAN